MITYEELEVTDAIAVLTPAVFNKVGNQPNCRAVMTCEYAALRFVMDEETTPSDTVGIRMEIGDVVVLSTIEQIRNFKAFVASISPLTPARLNVQYENNYWGFKVDDAETFQ